MKNQVYPVLLYPFKNQALVVGIGCNDFVNVKVPVKDSPDKKLLGLPKAFIKEQRSDQSFQGIAIKIFVGFEELILLTSILFIPIDMAS